MEIAAELAYADPSGPSKAIRAAATRTPRQGSLLRWTNYDDRAFAPIVARAARRRVIALYREERRRGYTRDEARWEAEDRYRYFCGFTPHHVRHLAAAVLWASGASDYEVAGVLGHESIETSKALYREWLPEGQLDAVRRAEDFRTHKLAKLGLAAGSP
jgi:hypothetical protein